MVLDPGGDVHGFDVKQLDEPRLVAPVEEFRGCRSGIMAYMKADLDNLPVVSIIRYHSWRALSRQRRKSCK